MKKGYVYDFEEAKDYFKEIVGDTKKLQELKLTQKESQEMWEKLKDKYQKQFKKFQSELKQLVDVKN